MHSTSNDGWRWIWPMQTMTHALQSAIFIRKVTARHRPLPTDNNFTARHNNYISALSNLSPKMFFVSGFLRSLIMANYSGRERREFPEYFTYSRVSRSEVRWSRSGRHRFKKWSLLKSGTPKSIWIFDSFLRNFFVNDFLLPIPPSSSAICLNYLHITINFCRQRVSFAPRRNLKN